MVANSAACCLRAFSITAGASPGESTARPEDIAGNRDRQPDMVSPEEAAGNRDLDPAAHLHGRDIRVGTIAPARIEAHGESGFARHETDRIDAASPRSDSSHGDEPSGSADRRSIRMKRYTRSVSRDDAGGSQRR